MIDERTLLNTEQSAQRLGLSTRTLERFRVTGEGPDFLKMGHAVRYTASALERWLRGCTRRSTSDDGRASGKTKKARKKKRDD